MITYRIGKTKYAGDLTGEGARRFGGRWNHPLTPCIYSSENRALALLEYSVNTSLDLIPRALSITIFEFPDDSLFEVPLSALPGDWRNFPSPSSTKDFGTTRLKANDQLVLKIPSSVIPEEFNYLLNPLHAEFDKVKLISVSDFIYDVRIKS